MLHIQYSSKVTATLLASLVLATSCTANTLDRSSSSNDAGSPAAPADVATTSNPCAGVNPCASDDPCAGSDSPATAEASAVETQAIHYFVDDNGLAIRGTDPVAYFTQGEPVAGNSEYTYTWNDATWQFASAENRDLFAANPDQYAPQYGGFCAWAVSQGYTASIDPNAWRIVGGKLYLNYSQGIQKRWERDIPGNIRKADANWPEVLADS